jgi:protein transport protein SEC24
MYLWVGRATSREALRETFGVEHVDALGTASHSVVPRLDTNANKSLNAFIDALRRMRSSYMRLRVLRRGDARENAYYRRLIEDRSPAGQSYVEFLCHVHRLIQNKFQ